MLKKPTSQLNGEFISLNIAGRLSDVLRDLVKSQVTKGRSKAKDEWKGAVCFLVRSCYEVLYHIRKLWFMCINAEYNRCLDRRMCGVGTRNKAFICNVDAERRKVFLYFLKGRCKGISFNASLLFASSARARLFQVQLQWGTDTVERRSSSWKRSWCAAYYLSSRHEQQGT